MISDYAIKWVIINPPTIKEVLLMKNMYEVSDYMPSNVNSANIWENLNHAFNMVKKCEEEMKQQDYEMKCNYYKERIKMLDKKIFGHPKEKKNRIWKWLFGRN